MNCHYCGATNSDEALFCHKCGKRLETTSQEASTLVSQTPLSLESQAFLPLSPYESSSFTAYGSSEPIHPPPPPFVSSNPYSEISNPYEQPLALIAPQKKRHQKLWIMLIIIGIVALLLVGLGSYVYINRSLSTTHVNQSTPNQTLEAACNAEKNYDFQTTYAQFSSSFQRQLGPEPAWGNKTQQELNDAGSLVNCIVNDVHKSSLSATGQLYLYFGTGHLDIFEETLIIENGTWKINNSVRIR